MSDQVASVLVTVDIVIPRLSPSGSGWEVALIQRKKQPYQGAWALPGGHLNTEDASLEAAAQRETQEETGLDIPLHLFQHVQTCQVPLAKAQGLAALPKEAAIGRLTATH
jgi:ADP-ribose pyrophosphatase YjhB (NUDIX family)